MHAILDREQLSDDVVLLRVAAPLIAAARQVMAGAADPVVRLSVPLVVDAGSGRNWAEAH